MKTCQRTVEMTKNNRNKQSKQKNKRMPVIRLPQQIAGAPSFGPVSTISTAPVAIGNSIKGTKPVVQMTVDGCRIIGRDFGFTATPTASNVSGWTLVGGMPITPSVMPSSALKSYTQMYAKFKINKIAFHYITSSPTSQSGDVLFYVERDCAGPFMDWTSNSFLPYTLSDPHTVLGPQWTNHTAIYSPTTGFKYTDYGVNSDINEDRCGAVYLFSKTSSTSSPGYVILDYDITFKELQVNPRAGVLPIARGQCLAVTFGASGVAATSGSTAPEPDMALSGSLTIAGTQSALPSGATLGDVYRCVADLTNSTVTGIGAAWTNCSSSNLLRYEQPAGGDTAVTIDDGFTFYAVYIAANKFRLYPTLQNAITGTLNFTYGNTATLTWNLCASASLVFSLNAQQQSSY